MLIIIIFPYFYFPSTNIVHNPPSSYTANSLIILACSLPPVQFSFSLWCCAPTRAMASSFLRFLDHTQRLITVGRTPLDVRLARRRDPYLTTHSTHNRQTSMSSVGFEPTISVGERPQTYALDRAATGTGTCCTIPNFISKLNHICRNNDIISFNKSSVFNISKFSVLSMVPNYPSKSKAFFLLI